MALDMKYFVLKPGTKKRNDPHARAAQAAMDTYASEIYNTDPELAKDLWDWSAIARVEQGLLTEE